MCGEKSRPFVGPCQRSGSPPRVRGKERDVGHLLDAGGITPACAGKSFLPLRSQQPARDHPRVCGEKWPLFARIASAIGSPPRVRGKELETLKAAEKQGITPACAGKSRSGRPRELHRRDHPRVCGEKFSYEWGSRGRKGSPPRVRGKACCMTQRQRRIRITPACAGKSISTLFPACDGQDHPRVCGEK